MRKAEASDKLARFHEFIKTRGLKSTRQRDEIASWFFKVKGHLSADRIYREIQQTSRGIGFSTVYRTMKLLCEAGLVSERHFRDAEALYENVAEHHDHCICTSCGAIIEFENDRIESLQQSVAQAFGFRLVSHKMELYGICADCGRRGESGSVE